MTAVHESPPVARSAVGPWFARIVVWTAFAATVWLAGPTAWRVVAAHASSRPRAVGEPVELERARLLAKPPAWLRGPVLRAFLQDLEPRLRGRVRIMDEDGARAVTARIEASPWVRKARLERRFPDRFRVDLGLRRPVLEVVAGERRLALVDADGTALPAPERPSGLPTTTLHHDVQRLLAIRLDYGEPFPDARVVAAAAVAREWAEDVAARVDAAPALLEVDAQNLGWHFVSDRTYSQVVIGLECGDGGTAYLHYGVAAAEGGPVQPEVKAEILRAMLAEHPGLADIQIGDLRRRNLWRHCLVTR